MRSDRQWMHSRHCGENSVTTWSPGATLVTPSPTSSTTPDALVAEHRRRVSGRVGAAGRVEVGVTHAAGGEAHQHLARPWPLKLDVLDDERVGELLEDGGADLHGGP